MTLTKIDKYPPPQLVTFEWHEASNTASTSQPTRAFNFKKQTMLTWIWMYWAKQSICRGSLCQMFYLNPRRVDTLQHLNLGSFERNRQIQLVRTRWISNACNDKSVVWVKFCRGLMLAIAHSLEVQKILQLFEVWQYTCNFLFSIGHPLWPILAKNWNASIDQERSMHHH